MRFIQLFLHNFLNSIFCTTFCLSSDGANVAYYMQNFDKGRFNYHQLQFVIDALESMNENPLVILPHKYCASSFKVKTGSQFRTQKLADDERNILDRYVFAVDHFSVDML